MKRLNHLLLSVTDRYSGLKPFAALLAMLVVVGCVGNLARNNTLYPVLVDAAADISAEARTAPGADTVVIDRFNASLTAKNYPAALADWLAVKAWAANSIDLDVVAGKLGPNAAASPRETLIRFDADLRKAARQ